ncbi:hypothetical protein SGLAM104S_00960 [Streptomyces glaucescens]
MFNLTDQVREQIQHTLYKLLVQRRSVLFSTSWTYDDGGALWEGRPRRRTA